MLEDLKTRWRTITSLSGWQSSFVLKPFPVDVDPTASTLPWNQRHLNQVVKKDYSRLKLRGSSGKPTYMVSSFNSSFSFQSPQKWKHLRMWLIKYWQLKNKKRERKSRSQTQPQCNLSSQEMGTVTFCSLLILVQWVLQSEVRWRFYPIIFDTNINKSAWFLRCINDFKCASGWHFTEAHNSEVGYALDSQSAKMENTQVMFEEQSALLGNSLGAETSCGPQTITSQSLLSLGDL